MWMCFTSCGLKTSIERGNLKTFAHLLNVTKESLSKELACIFNLFKILGEVLSLESLFGFTHPTYDRESVWGASAAQSLITDANGKPKKIKTVGESWYAERGTHYYVLCSEINFVAEISNLNMFWAPAWLSSWIETKANFAFEPSNLCPGISLVGKVSIIQKWRLWSLLRKALSSPSPRPRNTLQYKSNHHVNNPAEKPLLTGSLMSCYSYIYSGEVEAKSHCYVWLCNWE